MLNALPSGSTSWGRLLETKDDAAVVALTRELSLVQTVDFLTPIVDDPLWYGRIAAANSLSDVYAMGARPLTAMNIVGWPASLGTNALVEVLRGGMEKIDESGAELAGGHSIDDQEPKYGLAVTGIARPDEIVYNSGALPGDLLVLTKHLGIGVLASALKKAVITEEEMMPAMREAALLNAGASRAMLAAKVHACTDVTGYGLLGHLSEMLMASAARGGGRVGARIFAGAAPVHDGVLELIADSVYAGGLRANREYFGERVTGMPLDDPLAMILFDPQTSGGLLLAVRPERHAFLLSALDREAVEARTIGEIVPTEGIIELSRGLG